MVITSQTGQFTNPVFLGIGLYTIDLVPLPGVTSAVQMIPVVTGRGGGPAIGDADVSFGAGHATITVSIFSSFTGTPASDPFYIHVAFTA